MKLRMKLFDLKKLWKALDQDDSGVITTEEFIQLFLDDDAEMTGGNEDEDEFDMPLVPKSPELADASDLVVRAPHDLDIELTKIKPKANEQSEEMDEHELRLLHQVIAGQRRVGARLSEALARQQSLRRELIEYQKSSDTKPDEKGNGNARDLDDYSDDSSVDVLDEARNCGDPCSISNAKEQQKQVTTSCTMRCSF
jgi:hypothetical protein